ncbi:MAG: hypothetical protein LBH72_00090 [Proteiniphilum sp.]|jgi:hypothetical protein|nr:hypothetical protein [Proteiniphilum sp.]
MKRTVIALLFIGLCAVSQAQTDAPEWYIHKPVSRLSNVVLSTGAGVNLQEAFNNALIDASGESVGLMVNRQALSDMDSGLEITLPASNKKVKQMAVKHTKSGMVYVLIAVQKNVQYPPDFDKQVFDGKYNFSSSVFVPGMAQIYKGSKVKGFLFIAGEVALIGGVVACEGLRSSYESKINTTHDAASKRDHISNADNMQNLRNGFIAGAAAIYVWNVIDGIAAKGSPHIRLADNADLKILPYATLNTGGISLAINF